MAEHPESGFCVPCAVRQTPDKGLGVFAAAAIARGTIVWRHRPGLYTVCDEAAFRALLENRSHAEIVHELTHVFGLREFPGCLIRIRDDGALINHDPDANVATNHKTPATGGPDPSAPDYVAAVTAALLDDRYALIATRDIAAGEELTNDYAAEVADPPFYLALCEAYGVDEDYLDEPGADVS